MNRYFTVQEERMLAIQKEINSMIKSARKIDAMIKNIRVDNMQVLETDEVLLDKMKEMMTGTNLRKDILTLFDDVKVLQLKQLIEKLKDKHPKTEIINKVELLIKHGELWKTETDLYGRTN